MAWINGATYAKNSQVQNSLIHYSKSILENAINKMSLPEHSKTIKIADMGCAAGPNCLISMQHMIEMISRRFSIDACPDIQAFFCDLPCNDFNHLIQQWNLNYRSNAGFEGSFFAVVPGSVYQRLFPSSTLNLIFSSSCIHWLSEVPAEVFEPGSAAWNNGQIWLHGPDANKATAAAYAQQSQKDLAAFFRCRSEEMVEGAMMFLICPGRPQNYPPHQQIHENTCLAYLQIAWQQLTQEGLLEQHYLDSFNLPVYIFSTLEIKAASDLCPHLKVECLELIECVGDQYWYECSKNPTQFVCKQQEFYRSLLGNNIRNHVGPEKCDAIFERFGELIKQALDSQTTWNRKWAMPCSTIIMVLSKAVA